MNPRPKTRGRVEGTSEPKRVKVTRDDDDEFFYFLMMMMNVSLSLSLKKEEI